MKNKGDFQKTFLGSLGIFLHRNLGLHILISLIFNLIICVSLSGLFSLINYPVIDYTLLGFIIFIIVFTLIEVSLIIIFVGYYLKYIIKSRGLLLIVFYSLVFFITSLLIEDVSFIKPIILTLLVFSFSFIIFKLLLVILYQRYLLNKSGGKQE